jgi:hypothetical protein
MKFSMKEWRRIYDLVNELGRTLRDSQPTYTDDGSYIAPKINLTKDAQLNLEDKIKSLTQKSCTYMDQCGLKMPRPLWHYDRKNPETHASAPEFLYGHLLGDVA